MVKKSWLLALLFFACSCRCLADPVNLRFVVWEGDEGLPVLRLAIAKFETAHPDVHVKLEDVDYNNYFTKLLTQYAAGVAPDVAMMDPPNFQNFAKRGALSPLNQYFGDIPGFDIKAYYPLIVRTLSYKGTLYVLPRDIAPEGLLYYNKRLFDEAGVPYPDGSWTWDFDLRPELKEKDFQWVLQKLTKMDSRGRVTQYGLSPFDPAPMLDLFVYSQGATYADSFEDPKKVFFNSPKVLKAHKLLADLYLKRRWLASPSDLSSIVQSTAEQLFSKGMAAMYMCGIWDCSKVRLENKPGSKDFFEWDIAMAPAYVNGKRAFPSGGSGYAVVSSTAHPKEAWQFVTWMAGEVGMQALAKAGIAQPAIRKFALGAPWIPGKDAPREERYPANRILTDIETPYCVFPPTASYWPELSTFLKAKQDSIWNGTLTPEEGLNQAQSLATNRLNDILGEQKLPRLNWTAAALFIAGIVVALIAWVYLPERDRKLSIRENAENRAGYMFLAPWVIGTLVFTLGPMLVSLVMSAADWDIIQPAKWRGAMNYTEAFTADPRFWKSLGVTATYTFISVPVGIVIALSLALLLNLKVKGIAIYRTCFYLPALASTVASALVWRKVFQQDGGLLNSVIYGPNGDRNLLGVGSALSKVAGTPGPVNWLGNEHLALNSLMLMSFWTVGGSMVILLAGLQGIPQFYYEAATLDGASVWQRFRAVTFPLLTPSLFFVLITGSIGSFQVFTQVFVITTGQGSPNDATRVFMLHLYDAAFKNLRMGYASALAWVLFIVILAFTLAQFMLNKKVYYEADVA